MSDVHEQLRALLDKEGAAYRVLDHEAEGRTELITQIRGNRIEQAIKSMVVQVRMSKKENLYYLANVPGDCRVNFDAIKGTSTLPALVWPPAKKRKRSQAVSPAPFPRSPSTKSSVCSLIR